MPSTAPYKSSWPSLLAYGDTGPAVKWVQTILREQGFFKGDIGGNYFRLTKAAVSDFQSTHLGPDGQFLDTDGEVGKDTRWALLNPSGPAQRSKITTRVVKGLPEDHPRMRFLNTVIGDYRSGKFIEIPDGSNGGPTLSRFSRDTFWCCFYQSDAYQRTFGHYPMGRDWGHCKTFWQAALAEGMAFRKADEDPLPGDLGVILYPNSKTGAGHIFAIHRVSADGSQFNTFGGNEGNRLKHGLRNRSDGTIVGWIDLFGDRHFTRANFVPGVIAASASPSTLSGTR